MKIKSDEGYGAWSSTANEDGTFTFVQIKKDFVKEIYEIFEVEDKNHITIEDLDDIKTFVVGMFTDLINQNAFKKEVLTKEEYTKRFVKDERM